MEKVEIVWHCVIGSYRILLYNFENHVEIDLYYSVLLMAMDIFNLNKICVCELRTHKNPIVAFN